VLKLAPQNEEGKPEITAEKVTTIIRSQTLHSKRTIYLEKRMDHDRRQYDLHHPYLRANEPQEPVQPRSLDPTRYNPVAIIKDVLKDGAWHSREKLLRAISLPELRIRAYICEVRNDAEQKRRSQQVKDGGDLFSLAIACGQRVLETALHVLVWAGVVDQRGCGEVFEFRLANVPIDNAADGQEGNEDA
jgi:hypothetical protein